MIGNGPDFIIQGKKSVNCTPGSHEGKEGKTAVRTKVIQPSLRDRTTWRKAFRRDWHLYLLLLVPVALVIIFNYAAYPGLRMVFMDYKPAKGYDGSKWVGWQTFQKVFAEP